MKSNALLKTEAVIARADEIAATQTEQLLARTPGSGSAYERASAHMPLGVASLIPGVEALPHLSRSWEGLHCLGCRWK